MKQDFCECILCRYFEWKCCKFQQEITKIKGIGDEREFKTYNQIVTWFNEMPKIDLEH